MCVCMSVFFGRAFGPLRGGGAWESWSTWDTPSPCEMSSNLPIRDARNTNERERERERESVRVPLPLHQPFGTITLAAAKACTAFSDESSPLTGSAVHPSFPFSAAVISPFGAP